MKNKNNIIAKLTKALGNGKDWKFSHHIDLESVSGKCLCGHPIRHEYHIVNKKTGRTEIVGSECINTVPVLDAIKTQIEKIEAKKKAEFEKSALKLEAKRDKMAEKVIAIYDEDRQNNRWSAYPVWQMATQSYEPLKTWNGRLNRASKDISKLEEVLAKYGK